MAENWKKDVDRKVLKDDRHYNDDQITFTAIGLNKVHAPLVDGFSRAGSTTYREYSDKNIENKPQDPAKIIVRLVTMTSTSPVVYHCRRSTVAYLWRSFKVACVALRLHRSFRLTIQLTL